MTIIEAIGQRHAVRQYLDKSLQGDVLTALQDEVRECNAESGLNIQLIVGDSGIFGNFLAKYGKFSGVQNCVVLIGEKKDGLDEKAGYYGARITLKAQQLGLNTCWAALTFSRKKCAEMVGKGEKIVCAIALGYGATQGVQHKSRPMESLYKADGEMPDWFRSGIEAAILAPTALNQQKFLFTLLGSTVKAEATGGVNSKVDLGIVKYHFEAGAGTENFKWA